MNYKVSKMQINNYENNTNFGAAKVLSAKTIEQGCENVIDVYKLNLTDMPFVRRCLDVCQGIDRFITENDMNIHSNSTPKEALKDFFRAFLNKKGGDFYIAIKDNSIVSGVLRTVSSGWKRIDYCVAKKEIDINKKLVLDNDKITSTVLDDTLVKEMKKEVKGIEFSNNLIPNEHKDYYFLKSNVAGKEINYSAEVVPKKKTRYWGYGMRYDTNHSAEAMHLKKETPNTTYATTYDDVTEYDLAKVLDID